jgi:hypothetical protein
MKILPFFLILLLTSCKVSKNQREKTPKYFEGTIEFRVEYKSLNELFPVEKMRQTRPDKVIMYFESGNFVEEQFLNDTLIRRLWYNQTTNLNYYQWGSSDTLMYSNPSITDFSIDAIVQSDGEVILDHSTTKVKVLSRGKEGSHYEGNQNKLELYSSLELPINPEWYRNSHEFGYNRTKSLVPGISLKTRFVIFNYNEITRTATKIEWKDVELDLSVDSSKVLVRI